MPCRKSSRGFADGAAVQSGEGGWPGPEAPRRAAGSGLWADLEARPFVPWLGLPGRPAGREPRHSVLLPACVGRLCLLGEQLT